MSGNHPNENAEGGKFTSKVKNHIKLLRIRTSLAKNSLYLESMLSATMSNKREQDMQPKSESTRLEGPDGLVEYKGSHKLKHKKAIITGGE
jgi:hypothetical protein